MKEALAARGHRRRGLQRAAGGLGHLRPAGPVLTVRGRIATVGNAELARRCRVPHGREAGEGSNACVSICGLTSISDLSTIAPFARPVRRRARRVPARPARASRRSGTREVRTTHRVAERLDRAGLNPQLLPGTGLICDIGRAPRRSGRTAPCAPTSTRCRCATRPAWRTPRRVARRLATPAGTTCTPPRVLGAGLVLARPGPARAAAGPGAADLPARRGGHAGRRARRRRRRRPGRRRARVRPALRPAARTSACVGAAGRADHRPPPTMVLVRLHGRGGHTSRPHLTEDLVFALAQVVTQVPAVLSRRLDPRAGVALVWGRIAAGAAAERHPARPASSPAPCAAWTPASGRAAGALVADAVHEVVRPYGVHAEVSHTRGVPPTVNDAGRGAARRGGRARTSSARAAVVLAEQSLGGEDFAWMLEKVPGAMLRLGTRTPGGPHLRPAPGRLRGGRARDRRRGAGADRGRAA